MPLLHTWSLAVEEQFYIALPIFLVIIHRLHLSAKWIMALGVVACFAVGWWLSLNKPSFAYYLLPARAWELGVGALLAVGCFPDIRSRALREAFSGAGLLLIVASLFLIRSDMPFPGWVALAPCIGAALVIHSGGKTWVGRHIFASKPMVWVGLLSYSLYLWHWPVLASFRAMTASVQLTFGLACVAICLTFVLAWGSWRYIERPFRNRTGFPVRKAYGLLASGAVAIAIVALMSINTGGFPGRLDNGAMNALAASRDVDHLRDACRWSGKIAEDCMFGSVGEPVVYAIIGDSHAAALRPAIEHSGVIRGRGTLIWEPGCPLLLGSRMLQAPDERCRSLKSSVLEELDANPTIRTVILGGRWPYQLTGWRPEIGGSYRAWQTDAESTEKSVAENERVFERSLRRTLVELQRRAINVLVLGSVPEPGFDVPRITALALMHGASVPGAIERRVVESRAGVTDTVVAKVVSEFPNATFVPLWDMFCPGDWCSIERDGHPLYYDDDHISVYAATHVVAPVLRSRVQSLHCCQLGHVTQ